MNLKELKATYNQKVEEIKNKKDLDNKMATEMLAEIEELKNQIATQEKIEALEIEEFKNLENQGKLGGKEDMKKYTNENLVKLINGKATVEDREIYAAYKGQKEGTPADGGYLVPEEQIETLYEYKRALPNLEQYANVMTVSEPKGKMPIEVLANDKLANFTEGEEIDKSKITFGQKSWSTKDYGDLIAVTNQLLDDTSINLISYIQKRFAKKSVKTRNAEILTKLGTISNPAAVNKSKLVEGLLTEYYKLDPAFRTNAVLVTNSTGLTLLDTLIDSNGNPMLTRTYSDREMVKFRGIEVVEVSDVELPSVDTNKIPVFIGSLYDFVTVFDLKSLEIGISKEAMFTSNVTVLRAIERFDVVKVDEEAMKYIKVDPTK